MAEGGEGRGGGEKGREDGRGGEGRNGEAGGMEGRWKRKKNRVGSGMEAWRQGEGTRDEGERGADGRLEGRAEGSSGDAGISPGTAFSCTHNIHATTNGPRRCTELSTHTCRIVYTRADTKTHFVVILLELPQYQGSRDVDVFA